MTKEDCISRQAAIEVFGDIHPMDYNTQTYCDKIKALPTAERRGHHTEGPCDEETAILAVVEVVEKDGGLIVKVRKYSNDI